MDLVSVVIPVFNVEKYLERCIESVLKQTYMNIEVILVDDGSLDKSGDICDQLAKNDQRISVYHKANGGLSDARNYGVKKANGQYITFIDSDDYIAPNYIAYLYELLQKYDADISCCCMVKTEDDHAEYRANTELPVEQQMTGYEASQALMGKLYMVLVMAWGKLYRSEIVKKFFFPIGKKHEDEATTYQYYYESKRVVVGNQCLYAYYQNAMSITHTIGRELNKDAIWALEHRARFFEEKNERKLAKLAWEKVFFYCMQDSMRNGGRCDEYLSSHVCLKRLDFRMLFHWIVYKISPALYKKLRKIQRICLIALPHQI